MELAERNLNGVRMTADEVAKTLFFTLSDRSDEVSVESSEIYAALQESFALDLVTIV